MRILPSALLLLLTSVASTSVAQVNARSNQTATCQRYLFARSADWREVREEVAQEITVCVKTIASNAGFILRDAVQPTASKSEFVILSETDSTQKIARADVRSFLINQQAAYHRLSLAARSFENGNDAISDSLREVVRAAGDTLHMVLKRAELNRVLSAVLVTGGALQEGGTSGTAAGAENESSVTAHVVWESKHLRSRSERIVAEFAARGRIGFIPGIALFQDESAGVYSRYSQSFAWDLAPKINFAIRNRDASEFSVLLRAGQSILDARSKMVATSIGTVALTPIDTTGPDAAWFFEGGRNSARTTIRSKSFTQKDPQRPRFSMSGYLCVGTTGSDQLASSQVSIDRRCAASCDSLWTH